MLGVVPVTHARLSLYTTFFALTADRAARKVRFDRPKPIVAATAATASPASTSTAWWYLVYTHATLSPTATSPNQSAALLSVAYKPNVNAHAPET